MTRSRSPVSSAVEEFLAALTDAAYQVALRHGFRGSFLDVELDLWTALRQVVEREMYVCEPSAIPERREAADRREARRCRT